MPNFWERPELSGYLRDVQVKPDKYEWLGHLPKLTTSTSVDDSEFVPCTVPGK